MAKADPLQSCLDKLSNTQKLIYNDLVSLLDKNGSDTFNNCFQFNDEYSIKNVLARVAYSVDNEIQVENLYLNCWMSNYKSGGNEDYPMLSINPLKKESRKGQGERYYRVESYTKRTVPCHRITASLYHKELAYKDRGNQNSHRCYHKFQRCISPYHTVIRSDKKNKDMNGCKYGCANYCPHYPTCIFVDKNGNYLPCRNEKNKITLSNQCMHDGRCFAYMGNIESEESEESDKKPKKPKKPLIKKKPSKPSKPTTKRKRKREETSIDNDNIDITIKRRKTN